MNEKYEELKKELIEVKAKANQILEIEFATADEIKKLRELKRTLVLKKYKLEEKC